MQFTRCLTVAIIMLLGATGSCMAFGSGPHGPNNIGIRYTTELPDGSTGLSNLIHGDGPSWVILALGTGLIVVWAIRTKRNIHPPGPLWRS